MEIRRPHGRAIKGTGHSRNSSGGMDRFVAEMQACIDFCFDGYLVWNKVSQVSLSLSLLLSGMGMGREANTTRRDSWVGSGERILAHSCCIDAKRQ